jgi:hypothetical protein
MSLVNSLWPISHFKAMSHELTICCYSEVQRLLVLCLRANTKKEFQRVMNRIFSQMKETFELGDSNFLHNPTLKNTSMSSPVEMTDLYFVVYPGCSPMQCCSLLLSFNRCRTWTEWELHMIITMHGILVLLDRKLGFERWCWLVTALWLLRVHVRR